MSAGLPRQRQAGRGAAAGAGAAPGQEAARGGGRGGGPGSTGAGPRGARVALTGHAVGLGADGPPGARALQVLHLPRCPRPAAAAARGPRG